MGSSAQLVGVALRFDGRRGTSGRCHRRAAAGAWGVRLAAQRRDRNGADGLAVLLAKKSHGPF